MITHTLEHRERYKMESGSRNKKGGEKELMNLRE